ncbi:MAG: hypothetical protein ACYTDW_10730 [Planctomycetota bacterium]|jgi:hypothetical protein
MRKILFWLWFSVVSSPMLFGLGVVLIVACIFLTRKMAKIYRLRWQVGVIVLTVLVLSVVSSWKIQRFCSHVVDPKAYQVVEVDMTKEQVANLLGEPAERNLAVWRYEIKGVFEFVEIDFDENGRVKQKALDR